MDVDCKNDDVLGPLLAGVMVMWTVRSLVIEEAGDYLIAPGGSPDDWGQIRVTRCGSCWETLDIPFTPEDEPRIVFMPAGRYQVLFARDAAQPGQTGLVVKKVP